jgi:Na+/alanine symporter
MNLNLKKLNLKNHFATNVPFNYLLVGVSFILGGSIKRVTDIYQFIDLYQFIHFIILVVCLITLSDKACLNTIG